MVTIGHNILIICNLVTLLIKIIISVVCDLSHKTRQVTSEKKKMETDVLKSPEENVGLL